MNTNGSCIVDVEKLQNLQTLPKPELKPTKDAEYYISVDVARSTKNSNNETAIVVFKVKRDKKEKVKNSGLQNNVDNLKSFVAILYLCSEKNYLIY